MGLCDTFLPLKFQPIWHISNSCDFYCLWTALDILRKHLKLFFVPFSRPLQVEIQPIIALLLTSFILDAIFIFFPATTTKEAATSNFNKIFVIMPLYLNSMMSFSSMFFALSLAAHDWQILFTIFELVLLVEFFFLA